MVSGGQNCVFLSCWYQHLSIVPGEKILTVHQVLKDFYNPQKLKNRPKRFCKPLALSRLSSLVLLNFFLIFHSIRLGNDKQV